MIQNKIILPLFSILLLHTKILSCHKKVKMVLGLKFQVKRNPNDATVRCKKMIVGGFYCYKGKGIYSGTCSV